MDEEKMVQGLQEAGYSEKEIDKFIENGLTEEQYEQLLIEKEEQVSVSNGKVKFKRVNHSERAVKFGRLSDGDTTKYVNVALEYFGNRCALSGEEFVSFGKVSNSAAKSNLSAEHVVALCQGGDDIVPNLVPTVLQYNLRKNGYYLLDYWNKQKDINGKTLYSPYRLLKLVNYMMKSIEARGLDVKKYKQAILTPNEIDEYLKQIEEQDKKETDNNKRKIYSDTITTTTIDEDNKKILTEVPSIEGNIPTQKEQQKNQEQIKENEETQIRMMDTFLTDAIREIQENKELNQVVLQNKHGNSIALTEKIDQMLEKTIGKIPFEVQVRNNILKSLEKYGLEENKYSVANQLLRNTKILNIGDKSSEEQIEDKIENFVLELINELDIDLTSEQKIIEISQVPEILYDKKALEEEKNNIRRYKEYISEDINFDILHKRYLINALEIEEWFRETFKDKKIYERRMPNSRSTDKYEKSLGISLNNIKKEVFNKYYGMDIEKIESEADKQIVKILNKIYKEYRIGKYLKNVLAIKEWCKEKYGDKKIYERKLPSTNAKDKYEKDLGNHLHNIRKNVLNQYKGIAIEEIEDEEERKIVEIITRLEKEYAFGEQQKYYYLGQLLEIEEWCEETFRNKKMYERRLPNSKSEDNEYEKKLGTSLARIRFYINKPNEEIENEEHKKIVEILSKLDKEYGFDEYLKNALEIEAWCKENFKHNIDEKRIPRRRSKDKYEKSLASKLHNIEQKILKQYRGIEIEKIENEEHRKIAEIIDRIYKEYNHKRNKNIIDVQEATQDATTQGCDEKQIVMKQLEKSIEEQEKVS